jgi:hypothetical protein
MSKKAQAEREKAITDWWAARWRFQREELELWRELKAVTAELEVVIGGNLPAREQALAKAQRLVSALGFTQQELGKLAMNEPWQERP